MEQEQQKVFNTNTIFSNGYVYSKALYMYLFGTVPSINYFFGIDGQKAYKMLIVELGDMVKSIHTYRPYDKKIRDYEFDETVIICQSNCLIEIDTAYCEIYHDGKSDELVQQITAVLQKFRERQKRKPLEINLVVATDRGLVLRSMEIKRTKLDTDLFYNDDFKPVDELIRQRLNQKNDKGIVLLHGLPGTGKTTYLRYLVGKLKKRVLFLSPTTAGNLMNPEFIEMLIENPNTVLIIEDAEHIIMDRKSSGSSAVSNLLNISDGLLADFLNVQLICTFNSPLTMVDEALMRKGRMIAKYEFGKLSCVKAQRLSNHLGFATTIDRAMTVAEITNQADMDFKKEKPTVIGFRFPVMEN